MTDPTPSPRYELAHLKVERYERIELAELDVAPGLTVVAGENANGKTSLLEWVRQLFGGKGERRMPCVRTGSESAKGFAVLTADGKTAFTVEQEIRADGRADRLMVRDADGVATGKGQDWLKSLVGRGIALDPVAFDEPPGGKTPEARDKIRLGMLLPLVNLGIDLAAHAAKREDAYKKRTAVNRDVETTSAKLQTLGKRDVPESVDLAAKRAEIAKERSRDGDRRHHAGEVARIDKELEEIRQKFTSLGAKRADHVAAHATLGEALDVTALETAVSAGEKSNLERERILAANKTYDDTLAELGKWSALADKLSAEIKALDEAKVKALAAAPMPVEGMEITEAAILYKGLPYESASGAERMEIAFAVCAADKPQLGIALIEDAEKLGLPVVERVREIAKRRGLRVLMARRSPDIDAAGKVEIVDGRLAS